MRSANTLAVLIAALWASSCGITGRSGPVVHEHHTVERGAATSVRVAIDMSAGELEIDAGAQALFDGDFDFNVPALKPEIKYTVSGRTGALNVSQGSTSGNYQNHWRIGLSEGTPVDLSVRLGAGDAKLLLGRLNLRSLSIRLGAGDLDVDLRGTPSQSYNVKVQAGAGDTTVHLPVTVGVSARTAGLIGDVNVRGLEKRDGRWVNAKSNTSPVMIELEVQHAIGDLKLQAE